MALIKCYECSAEISDKATYCPNCGAPVVVHKWKCSRCGNMISGESCPYCGNSKKDANKNTSNENENRSGLDSFDYNQNHQAIKKGNKAKTVWIVLVLMVAAIAIIAFWVNGYFSNNDKNKTVDMGAVGNKITVDGTVAYVAGENKILVPYDFRGDFSTCNSEAYGKNLKGCENPRLPTDETNDLPEEVTREIISLYGETGGFWTSVEADHANIEIAGVESESLHYAGIMDNYFSVGDDGVADAVWGYCLDATSDTTTMGLLVLYDVIVDEFEFTDVEDTANPNYSTEPVFDSSAESTSEIQEESQSESLIYSEDVYPDDLYDWSSSILPFSSDRLLTYDDISYLSREQLILARNEIYARHGRIFKVDWIKKYFEAQPWYYGTLTEEEFSLDLLSDIEMENIMFIKNYEEHSDE